MDTFLAICQGIGLAIAAGLGGVLVPLLAAVLAGAEIGWDLSGTDFEFVSETWFIGVCLVANIATFAVRRQRWSTNAVLLVTAALAAILFAASLAERDLTPWPGLAGGLVICVATGLLAASVLRSAATRAAAGGADEMADSANAVVLFAAGGGIALCFLALLLEPASLVALAGVAAVALSRRRTANQKYAGLRILR